jgi:hypothetical protein
MEKKSNKGTGEFQTEAKIKSRKAIIMSLIDNQWHRYKEIKEKTGLSSPTLSKHLTQLKPLLEKKTDTTTYPPLVYYKTNKFLATELARIVYTATALKEMAEKFLKTKDLWQAVKDVNMLSNALLWVILQGIKENKTLRKEPETIFVLLETFVWENYKALTWKLVDASRKIMDDIDFQQILENMKKGDL